MAELGNDPLNSFLSSIQFQVVHNAFSPLESNFRKVTKDFEHCFKGISKCGNLNRSVNDEKAFPIKTLVGIFREKGVCNKASVSFDGVEKLNANSSKKGLKESYGSDNGGKDVRNHNNFLHFELALSFLINSFVQNFPRPFKSEKMRVQKMSNEDNFYVNGSNLNVEAISRVGDEINETELNVKEGDNFQSELCTAFVFDQLNHVPKFDVSVHENEFGRFKSLTSLLEGKRANVNEIWGNLKFARVRGVPLGILEVPSVNNEGGEVLAGAVNHEEDTKLVAVPPPAEITAKSILKSALAGGLSCSFSTALMHPVDTVKTQVQASTSLGFIEILSKVPQIGVRGVYKGSIPAILGQFTSHGLRTGIYEVSKLVLTNVAPTVPELQVQSAASFCATVLGTVWRIPCEVLKQRLQANVFDNTGQAIIGTWKQDGLSGFFRGTGATLCREIPFYVAGAGLYAESKKAVKKLIKRELEPWETIVIGAISGGLIAISTTPFDVIKTRMMISPKGHSITASMVALSILQNEGPFGLFRGAAPRFFWIAPLGAINFAGYELLRKAMEHW